LESAGFVSTGKLVSLSEQQVVDCDKDENQGCQGGWPYKTFKWMEKGNGLTLEEQYPYRGSDGFCATGVLTATVITGYSTIAQDETQIKAALNTYGPLSVALNASPLQSYKSGIFDSNCTGQSNHAVVIVGYGSENGQQYWKVRNSWGESWGESGYFRIAWGSDKCNIADDVSTATGISVDDTPHACVEKDVGYTPGQFGCTVTPEGADLLRSECPSALFDKVTPTGLSDEDGLCHWLCHCKSTSIIV